MAESYDLEITVVSTQGSCGVGHKVGDRWIMGDATPGGICIAAYNTLYPDICILKYGGTIPWNENPDVDRCGCPDPANRVVFEIKRLKKPENKST